MAATQTVGDPVCRLASNGPPAPSLVPTGVRIGTGTVGGYTCYIW